jgi:hypothetical protein
MYLKATIQKVTGFGYFAKFGREQTFEQSNWNLAPQTLLLTIILSIFFITSFYLKWLWHGWQNLWWEKNDKKKLSLSRILSLNCQALSRALARNFSRFLTGVPPLGTSTISILPL